MKVHQVASVQALDLGRTDASYELEARQGSQISLAANSAAARDRLVQARLGDDLLIYDADRLRPEGLAATPHLRVRSYFAQQPPVTIDLAVAGVQVTLTPSINQYLGISAMRYWKARSRRILPGARDRIAIASILPRGRVGGRWITCLRTASSTPSNC